MKIIVVKEFQTTVLFKQVFEERCFKIENGTLIWYFVNMRYRSLIAWLGDQHAAGIRIKRIAEDVEKKITFSYKTDAERFAVLRLGRFTVYTAALEIHDPVEIRSVKRMDVCFHKAKIIQIAYFKQGASIGILLFRP